MTRRDVLLLAVVLGLSAAHAAAYGKPFEDSFITFRYVDNLLAGHGLAFNPGERVEGFTSFGWVMVLAGARLAGLSLPRFAPLLSGAFGLGLIALTALAARRLMRPSPYLWLAPPLLLAAFGTWAYWSATGMETSCFAFVVGLAVLLAARSGGRNALGAGLMLGVASLLRPEGAGYFAVVVVALATLPAARRSLVQLCLGFAVLFLPWFAWRWSYFGYPFPNTYYAKATGAAGHLWAGLFQTEHFLTLHLLWAVPVALYLIVKSDGASRWVRLAAGVCAGACADVLLVGGDSFAFYRFFLPALPWALLILVEGAREAGRRLAARRAALSRRAAPLAALATALYAAVCFGAAFVPPLTLTGSDGEPMVQKVREVADINAQYFIVGRWLRQHAPAGSTIAVNAAGIVPYESGLATIDMLGLNDVHIAHHAVTTHGALGHEKHDAAYVLSRRPELIVPGLPMLATRRLRGADLVRWFTHFFPFLPGDRELFENPAFLRQYAATSLAVDDHGYFTFFIRKDVSLRGIHFRN